MSPSLPLKPPRWQTIPSIAFAVVVFSLFARAPPVEPASRHGRLVD